MRLTLFILILTLSASLVRGQSSDTVAEPQKPKAGFVSNVVFQFDNRSERYFENRGRMNGLKLGLEFKKRLRMGVGFYGNANHQRIHPLLGESYTRTGKLSYTTFFSEIVFYRSWKWELAASGAMGRGRLEVFNYPPEGFKSQLFERIKVRDIGATAQYKIWPWFGVGVGMGYRWTLDIPDEQILDSYKDTYIDLKLKLFLGYAVKSIFKPEAIKEEKAYYEWRKEKRHKAFKSLFNND